MNVEQVDLDCSVELQKVVDYDSEYLYMLSSEQSYKLNYESLYIITKETTHQIVGYLGVREDVVTIITHYIDIDMCKAIVTTLLDSMNNSTLPNKDFHTNNVNVIKELLLQGCKIVSSLNTMTFRKETRKC